MLELNKTMHFVKSYNVKCCFASFFPFLMPKLNVRMREVIQFLLKSILKNQLPKYYSKAVDIRDLCCLTGIHLRIQLFIQSIKIIYCLNVTAVQSTTGLYVVPQGSILGPDLFSPKVIAMEKKTWMRLWWDSTTL